MKHAFSLIALTLALLLTLTGCGGSGNGSSSQAETVANPHEFPEGFAITEPEGYEKVTLETQVELPIETPATAPEGEGESTSEGEAPKTELVTTATAHAYEKDASRLVFRWSRVTTAVAKTFDEAADAADISKFAEQYTGGMEEYQADKMKVLDWNGLRISGTLTSDTEFGKAGEATMQGIFPLDRYVIVLEGYGPEAQALVDAALASASYEPPVVEEESSQEQSK